MSESADLRRSKRMSFILRHAPESAGLSLDPNGWIPVVDLLAALDASRTPTTRDDLARVVRTSDKRRFEWDVASDRIRARQGHSVPVDLGLEESTPPEELFHGTPKHNVEIILRTGLDRRRRHHVHLSEDVDTAHVVGARRGAHVVLRVDTAGMTRGGYEFWRSSNGVWLTERVPPGFLTLLD